ncbi:metallophosphoesterase [Geobacter sp. DSM 9736]|uniref:metallophosphoesterase family protein n=1 Tax=Geobacter sp. DSM 9736 TaxID=1277350 RepID=UPI000B50CC5D|nr:metallophosphoesterase family protein [Geobacter sp. DSM 9736]SNB45824.1 3',5'-cyclic AMP phosphodiesterase CpdA [Geobacter sp. DSM 9736]
MRTIVHISDIHFGRIAYPTVQPLIDAVRGVHPDVVVVSGDLTQRASERQFAEARDFLAQLPSPQIIVPGNHDVPLFNVVGRFFRPLANFRRYISSEAEPFYSDNEIAVLGLNTARSLTFKNGRINHEQISRVRQRFCSIDSKVIKVLVTHHPLDLPRQWRKATVVGRADMAMKVMASCGADLLLAGHYHVSHTGGTASRYPIQGYSALVVHAGTATSTRGRGELNTFNVLRIERPFVTIERYYWRVEQGIFQVFREERYQQAGEGWLLS